MLLLLVLACAGGKNTDLGATDDTGTTDCSTPLTVYPDNDGDGFAADNVAPLEGTFCEVPDGAAASLGDCDDANPGINPGATEMCDGTGIDEDCDGLVNDDDDSLDTSSVTPSYADADHDGYGDAQTASSTCMPPDGYIPDGTDCDDADADVHPGATEICDDHGADEDCNGVANDDDAGVDPSTESTFYADADADGYGGATSTVAACSLPDGYEADATDCDDANPAAHPGATEICDPLDADEDCDGLADAADDSVDPATYTTSYMDMDGDGYGSPAMSTTGCEVPSGYVTDGTDCADAVAGVNPGAAEVCDGTDDDCDGLVDDADPSIDPATLTMSWSDVDGDGYGDPATAVSTCEIPTGNVLDSSDCLDSDAAVSPAGVEVCDAANLDEDCDGLADDADTPTVASMTTMWADADGDGYGDILTSFTGCDAPAGYVADGTDCDDAIATINPGETEVCDASDVDEDCNGLADDADPDVDPASETTWYADPDGNGVGEPANPVSACEATAGYVSTLATPDTDVCSSVVLDDTTDSGTVPGADFTFSRGDAFTVAFRASIDPAYNGYILTKGDNSTSEWSITAISTGTTTTTLCLTRQGLATLNCKTVDAGDYHHYAVAYNAGSSTWYEDGAALGTASGNIGTGSTTSALTFGNYPAGEYASMGEFDEVVVFASALSATDVANLYTESTRPDDYTSTVGWWRFDEGSGEETLDLSGRGNDMTLSGPSWTVDCLTDICASTAVDDATDYGTVRGGADIAYDPSWAFTLDFVADISPGAVGYVLVKGDATTTDWAVFADASLFPGIVTYSLMGPSGEIARVLTTSDAWHEVTITYDAGSVRMAIDGTVTATGTGMIGAATASDITFANSASGTDAAEGYFDRLAFLDGAATDAEIRGLYDGSLRWTDFTAVFAWSFDTYGATTIVDETENGYDITLSGTTGALECPE